MSIYEAIEVRAYGRQELALKYFPHMTPDSAWRKLRGWMKVNPRLRTITAETNTRTFTPRQVRQIVDELGEP